MNTTTLSVLVPVFNEEHLVAESLNRLFVLEESHYLERIQVIVVDDGSQDGTPEVLKRLAEKLPHRSNKFEWKFLMHKMNMGKGKAIQTALNEATCEVTVIHDADLEYHPRDIMRIVRVAVEEGADAVYGSRFLPYEFRRVLMYRHQLGNRFLTFISNLISNQNLTDMETCYKAVRTDLLKSIPIRSNDFRFEVELTLKLAKRRARLFEVPIDYSGRTYQEGKKIGWGDGLKAILALVRFGCSDDIFKEDQYGSHVLARLSKARRFNRWLLDTIEPFVGQHVLEIGAGIGNLTRMLIPRKSYHATDINPFYLQIMENLRSDKPYLSASFLDLNDVSEFVDNQHLYDTAICINVVEHLEDDVRAMQNIAHLLSQDGTAIVLVPRGEWLFGSLDEVLGHRRRYSKEMLTGLSQEAGLTVTQIMPFNRVSTIPWLVNGKILKRRSFGLVQVFLLNLFMPILRRIDKFLPVPSMSYIAILKKSQRGFE
jgi:glycosyltransferase involved in cell wall biosynthesis